MNKKVDNVPYNYIEFKSIILPFDWGVAPLVGLSTYALLIKIRTDANYILSSFCLFLTTKSFIVHVLRKDTLDVF